MSKVLFQKSFSKFHAMQPENRAYLICRKKGVAVFGEFV